LAQAACSDSGTTVWKGLFMARPLYLIFVSLCHAALRAGRGVVHVYPSFPASMNMPHCIVLIDPDAESASSTRKVMQAVAKNNKNRDILFIELGKDQADAVKFFNLEVQETPFLMIVRWDSGMGRHPFSKFRFWFPGEDRDFDDQVNRSLTEADVRFLC